MSEKKKKTGILGYAAIMGIIILFSKVLGLFRDILVANFYGTGTESIAYEAASRIPVTIFDLVIGGVVSSAFIPVFNSVLVKKGKKDAMDFANSYVNFILLICSVIAALGMIFAKGLVTLVAPDISTEAAELAVRLTRIMFPMIIFTGLAYSFVGVLQSLGEYNLPALISLFSNTIMVVYLFTLNRFFGVVGLSVAMLLGWASQAIVQIPKVHSFGFRYRPKVKIFDPTLMRAAKNALPILVGTWTTPICNVINTRYASDIENGRAITVLGYANRLYIMIVGLFSFVATNLLFPYFSRAEASGDREGASKMIRTSVKTLIYIIAPIAVGIMLLSEPFTAIVYERGSFDAGDTVLTAQALSKYAVGMLFMAANEVMVKALFAAEKSKLPMFSSLAALVFNIILVSNFSSRLGVGGIALVSSIATVINLVINLIFAHRTGVCRFGGRDVLDIVSSVVSAAAMIPVIFIVKSQFASNIMCVALSVIAAAPVYFIVSLALRSEEAKFITKAVKTKLKRGI